MPATPVGLRVHPSRCSGREAAADKEATKTLETQDLYSELHSEALNPPLQGSGAGRAACECKNKTLCF